ncbi:MAG: hypothetical protein ACR2RB_09110 [Gammaproteobacteria bacterium]
MKRNRAITAGAAALAMILTTGDAVADGVFESGGLFDIEFEESLLAPADTRFHQLHGDQLYKDNGIRNGNVMHTALDYLYHYAMRRMSRKARRRSLGPEDENRPRRERRSKLSLKVSSHKIYVRAGIKF